jgi:hypothetical protein
MAKNTKTKVQEESVKASEFVEFKKTVEETQNRMLDILEEMTKSRQEQKDVATAVQEAKVEATPSKDGEPNGFLPPQYQKVFEKHFDINDGFTGRLNFPEMDETGAEMGGITFTIVVPQKFTNMSDAHQKFYKIDLRTVALRPENIVRGIDSWCSKVAKNIKYNKLLRTK